MFHWYVPWLPKVETFFLHLLGEIRRCDHLQVWHTGIHVKRWDSRAESKRILKSNKLQKLAKSEIWCLIHVFQASHSNQWVFQLLEVSFHRTCSLCWLWRGGSLSFFPSFFRFQWTTRNICNVIISFAMQSGTNFISFCRKLRQESKKTAEEQAQKEFYGLWC